MKQFSHVRNEQGYTLIETLVAMALFGTVLIPLLATVGNFMLDRSGERLDRALQIAETEMSRVIAERDFTEVSNSVEVGLVLKRTIHRARNRVEIEITVAQAKQPDKPILALTRVCLNYQ